MAVGAVVVAAILLFAIAAQLLGFRYSITNNARGESIRLDRWTGEIMACDKTGCLKIPVDQTANASTL